uniref:Uncharacterized protein n=1 Tax=Physcomitrium patens TaxID=3218 RepID=A0A2K1J3N5_PHYPA|nr:hypothetical protein PHYPA_021984 [Physcomitrium patens]
MLSSGGTSSSPVGNSGKSGSAMVCAGTRAIVVASTAAAPSGLAVMTSALAPEAVASPMIGSALLGHPGPFVTMSRSPVFSSGVAMSPNTCTFVKPRWNSRIAKPRMMRPSLPTP